MAARRRMGFLRRECGLWCSLDSNPRSSPPGCFPIQGQVHAVPWELEAQPWNIIGRALSAGHLLPAHFLFVGGNKMAANVSNVKGNLRRCHGQGITSAYSYRMYHLQRIPCTTHSKNEKKKKALNSWLNSIYIFHSIFFSSCGFSPKSTLTCH